MGCISQMKMLNGLSSSSEHLGSSNLDITAVGTTAGGDLLGVSV
jgi:hypothetical protein